tara:strand:- start:1648 stop:1983 length:336 start_codon:yes stop_codon:yes gene_type:complete
LFLQPAARRPGLRALSEHGLRALSEQTSKHPPIATFRSPAAAQGMAALLSEQTSKRPRTKDFKPIVVLPTAALQFAAAAWIPGKLLSEQTSKQLSTGCPQFVVSYPQVTAE